MGWMFRNPVSFAGGILAFLIASGFAGPSVAQQAPQNGAVVISLSDAIHRAQQNEPGFASALAAEKSAAIDRYLAKAALLPSVVAHNQMLYTQPNGQINRNVQAGAQASLFRGWSTAQTATASTPDSGARFCPGRLAAEEPRSLATGPVSRCSRLAIARYLADLAPAD